jgi:hypothetical protein
MPVDTAAAALGGFRTFPPLRRPRLRRIARRRQTVRGSRTIRRSALAILSGIWPIPAPVLQCDDRRDETQSAVLQGRPSLCRRPVRDAYRSDRTPAFVNGAPFFGSTKRHPSVRVPWVADMNLALAGRTQNGTWVSETASIQGWKTSVEPTEIHLPWPDAPPTATGGSPAPYQQARRLVLVAGLGAGSTGRADQLHRPSDQLAHHTVSGHQPHACNGCKGDVRHRFDNKDHL